MDKLWKTKKKARSKQKFKLSKNFKTIFPMMNGAATSNSLRADEVQAGNQKWKHTEFSRWDIKGTMTTFGFLPYNYGFTCWGNNFMPSLKIKICYVLESIWRRKEHPKCVSSGQHVAFQNISEMISCWWCAMQMRFKVFLYSLLC